MAAIEHSNTPPVFTPPSENQVRTITFKAFLSIKAGYSNKATW